MIKILIAESELLVAEGLKSLINTIDHLKVVKVTDKGASLLTDIKYFYPDVVVIDYIADGFQISDIEIIRAVNGDVKILALTHLSEKKIISKALRSGLNGHILKCCDRAEIEDSIFSTYKGENFYCGKVIAALREDKTDTDASCEPISLSNRELQIIERIAAGSGNKEIAEQLFLSVHTVMTHRKNIMAKLGVNNTAGIVIYAVKENIISPNEYLFTPSKS